MVTRAVTLGWQHRTAARGHKMSYLTTPDGSLADESGRILCYSIDRFLNEICGDAIRCFICGTTPDVAAFNEEHVIPDWLLRKHGLHDNSISLPNAQDWTYARYKIPCCVRCNSMLSERLEHPLREAMSGGYESFAQYLKANGPARLFVWLNLLFFKTHYRDLKLRFHRDARKGDERIGDLHDWGSMHHVHCVCRTPFTEVELASRAFGSLLILPAEQVPNMESFDYRDLHASKTMLVRSNDIAILAVLDDSCGAQSAWRDRFARLSGPLSPIQLVELMCMLAAANEDIIERPEYSTIVDSSGVRIDATLHPLRFRERDAEEYGRMMWELTRPLVEKMRTREGFDIKAATLSGGLSYLFTPDGEFNRESVVYENANVETPRDR